MHTASVTAPRQQTLASHRPSPLVSVMAWELRRFRASHLFWWQMLGFLGFALFVIWTRMMPAQFTGHGFVAETSAWGLLLTLPTSALLLLGVLLPFVSADGVTRDLHRRTHELLMTTPLSSWAYVWGRYLTGLLMSLGLAVLALVALLGMGWVLHASVPDYPAPEIGNLLTLWGSLVVPATVLISSLSFALATAFPRGSTVAKIVIMLGWFVGSLILPSEFTQTSLPTWYVAWDPTGAVTAMGTLSQYAFAPRPEMDTAQWQQLLLAAENKVPDVSAWLAPHVILAGLSILLVLASAFSFRRFGTALGS